MGDVLIDVTIEGVAPLLLHAYTDAAAQKATTGQGAVAVGDPGTPREQAEDVLYRDTDGTLIVPGANVYRAIIDAGKFHKSGKSKVTTMKNSLVPTGVWMETAVCPIDDGGKGWEVDTRPIRIPSTGGRILRHRPRFDTWRLSFSLRVDTSTFDTKIVRALIDDAGSKIGLGDFRPDCKGPFGRFVVVAWSET